MTVVVNNKNEYCLSRADPKRHHKKEMAPDKTQPTMTALSGADNYSTKQLEASHEVILVPSWPSGSPDGKSGGRVHNAVKKSLQKVMGVSFIATANRNHRNLKFIMNFDRKRYDKIIACLNLKT